MAATSLNGYGHGLHQKGIRTSRSGAMTTGIVAAGEYIAFGAMVSRNADGYVQATPTASSTVYDYLGLACDDVRKHLVDGFYGPGGEVPILVNGAGMGWLLGGQTIDTGNFVKNAGAIGAGTEGLGVLIPESTPKTRSLLTVGKYIGQADMGDGAYAAACTTYSGTTITFGSNAIKEAILFQSGDYIAIAQSGTISEVNRVVDAELGSTTMSVVKTATGAFTTPTIYRLQPMEVLLL